MLFEDVRSENSFSKSAQIKKFTLKGLSVLKLLKKS